MSLIGAPVTAETPFADNLRGAGFMIIAVSAFAFGDTCMKLVAEHVPLYQAIALRGLLTLPILALIGVMSGGLRFGLIFRSWPVITLRTIGEVTSTITYFFALMSLPLAMVSAIMQSAPLALTAGAALFLGEKVGWKRWSAVIFGFIGVVIIVRPGPQGLDPYAMVALLSVLCVVLRDLTTRRLPKDVPSVGVALLAALSVTIFGFIVMPPWNWQPFPAVVIPLLLMATAFVIVGYISAIRVMRIGDMGFVTPFRYFSLVLAIILSWAIWDFFPDGLTLLGAGIVVASGLFTLLREASLNKKAKAKRASLQR